MQAGVVGVSERAVQVEGGGGHGQLMAAEIHGQLMAAEIVGDNCSMRHVFVYMQFTVTIRQSLQKCFSKQK